MLRGSETGLTGEGRPVMPRYEFLCQKCQKPFERTLSLAERDRAEVRCPACHGAKVVPQLGGAMVQTAKKS